MFNSENIKTAFSVLKARDDVAVSVLKKAETKRTAISRVPHYAKVVTAAVVVILSLTMVAFAVTNWSFLADVFRNVFNDPISAGVVEAGGVQTLDIVNGNDAFTLKLIAFTGDKETQFALFELVPTQDLPEFDSIKLRGKTASPGVIEANMLGSYMSSEVKGYALSYDSSLNTYYFSYRLPPFWVRDTNEDIVLCISRITFYNGGKPVDSMVCDMSFRFAPDRNILADALVVKPNMTIEKSVFEIIAFFTDESRYDEMLVDINTIVAAKTEATVQIDKVVFSKYSTEISCIIKGETLTGRQAGIIWDQFTEPRFTTNHYWDGLEKQSHYEGVAVDNDQRIRLFADGIEVPVDEGSLSLYPGQTEGGFDACIEFDAVDYEAAGSVEIHFGDVVIPLK